MFTFAQYFYFEKAIFFLIGMALKAIITNSLSIDANTKCRCAVSQKESDLSY